MKGHSREIMSSCRAPVEDTPVTSSGEVFTNAFETHVGSTIWCCGEARQEASCITNIRTTQDKGVGDFSKDSAI